MRLFSLLGAVLLAAAPVLAQEAVPLIPGHQDLVPDALSYSDQTFDVRTVEPNQSLGTITQTATMDGAYVVVVTDANVPQLGQVGRDSVRILRASLAPDYVVVTAPNGTVSTVNFNALRVVGSYGPAGRTLPIDLELKEPAFHAGSSVLASGAALVARALPFEEGFVGTFSTFSPTQRLGEATLTVAGREDVPTMGGETVSAWVVEESAMPGGPAQRTYYVDPETRDLVRVAFSQRGTEAVIVPADPEAMAAEAAAREAIPMIMPGSDMLMASRATPYTQDATLQLTQPQQMELGTANSQLMVDEAAGTATLLTRITITMQGATQMDSLVMAYPSFAPISQTATGGGATIEVMYGESEITGQIVAPGGEVTEINETLDAPVFAASSLSEVVRALPLAEGYQARFRAYAPGAGVNTYTVDVTGMNETLGGWTVTVSPESAPPTIYVIEPETRDILQTTLQPQVGVSLEVRPQG